MARARVHSKEATILDVVDYLTARWNEDETSLRQLIGELTGGPGWGADSTLPIRLVADLASKRHIVRLHRPLWPEEHEPLCQVCGDPMMDLARAPWPCATVMAMVQPFATYPDFDPGWHRDL
jgi:hypothetical protein